MIAMRQVSTDKRERITEIGISRIDQYQPRNQDEKALTMQIIRPEAERALIGSVLQQPDLFTLVADQLQGGDFFIGIYAFIWTAFTQLSAEDKGIDLITVSNLLESMSRCPEKGQVLKTTLAELYGAAPAAEHIETYAAIVRESATRLRVLKAAERVRMIAAAPGSLDALIDEVNHSIFTATEQSSGSKNQTDMLSITKRVWDLADDARAGLGSPILRTGMRDFDATLGGIAPGELTIFAGGEKMGKTTLAMTMMVNMLREGKRIVLFSCEMSQVEVTRIFAAMLGAIPRGVVKSGAMNGYQYGEFLKALGEIATWKLDIVDEYPNITPLQIQRRFRKLKQEHGQIDLVVVDGLWLMDSDNPKLSERHQKVNDITMKMTAFAKTFQIPLIVTHQYREQVYQRNATAPLLNDLGESAGVRRNAQVIVALWRQAHISDKSKDSTSRIHVLADRNGDAQGQSFQIGWDNKRTCYCDSCSENDSTSVNAIIAEAKQGKTLKELDQAYEEFETERSSAKKGKSRAKKVEHDDETPVHQPV